MSEYILSDELGCSLAVNLEDGSWRFIGLPNKRYFYEWDTGQLLTSFNGGVYLQEDEVAQPTTDGTAPVLWQVQTRAWRGDIEHKGTPSMLYVDINTRGQLVMTSLVMGEYGEDVLYFIGEFATADKRVTVELPIPGATIQTLQFAVHLRCFSRARIDLYGIELDVEVPEPLRQ